METIDFESKYYTSKQKIQDLEDLRSVDKRSIIGLVVLRAAQFVAIGILLYELTK